MKLQSQTLTSLQLGPHTYHVLDLRVDIGGEDIPIFKDETGRLCVFSRLLSKVAGYQQKDTLYRMIQRQTEQRLMTEGLTHRMESAQEMHALCTRLALHFPVLNGLLFRVRTPEALVYSQSFPVLQGISKLDLQPVFAVILDVERALQAKPSVSADEALVDELASVFAGEQVKPPAESPVATETTAPSEPKMETAPVETCASTMRSEETTVPELASTTVEAMEEAVRDLATAIDVPVQGQFITNLVANSPPRKKKLDPEMMLPMNLQDLISDADIPQENAWVPPGYPEVYEDITGSWVGKVYAWVLLQGVDSCKRGVGANLPNLPLLLRAILQSCGFLGLAGTPSNDGKYFIFQEKTGSLQFNKRILPKLLCTFLATNPDMDYREFLGTVPPTKINVQEVQKLAQRLVKEMHP